MPKYIYSILITNNNKNNLMLLWSYFSLFSLFFYKKPLKVFFLNALGYELPHYLLKYCLDQVRHQ